MAPDNSESVPWEYRSRMRNSEWYPGMTVGPGQSACVAARMGLLIVLGILWAVCSGTGSVAIAAERSGGLIDEPVAETRVHISAAAAEPSDDEAARKRLQEIAAAFGTDPTAIVSYYEFHYEHDHLPAGARTDNAVAIASLALTPSWLLRVTMPYMWDVPNQPDTSNTKGAGDMEVRVGARVYNSPYLALFVGTDVLFPTASNEQLGAGKYTLGPGIVATVPIPMLRSLFSVLVQNFKSVGGDPRRPKIDYAQFQLTLNTIWSEQWYTSLLPTVNVDWSRGGKSGMKVEAEIGYQFYGRWEAFLHPGVGLWGNDLQTGYDWIVQCGVRWVFSSPLFP